MKSKVIHVDFANRTRRVTCSDETINKGLLTVIKEKLKKTFSFTEEPAKAKKEAYSFKRMM